MTTAALNHRQIVLATTAALELLTGVSAASYNIVRSRSSNTKCTGVFVDLRSNEGCDVVGEGPTAYVNVRQTEYGCRLRAADKIRSFFDEIGLEDVRVYAGSYRAESEPAFENTQPEAC